MSPYPILAHVEGCKYGLSKPVDLCECGGRLFTPGQPDLVPHQRLEQIRVSSAHHYGVESSRSADDVAYLLALIDTLQRQFEDADDRADGLATKCRLLEHDRSTLEAHVSRLTEALRRIALLDPFIDRPFWDEPLARSLQNIAKAALSSPPQEQKP